MLTTFPPSLSAKAKRSLERLGVTVLTSRTRHRRRRRRRDRRRRAASPSRTVIWAAGVTASSLAARLGELTDAERDRAGRVTVEPDLTLPGHPEVFALGDMVRADSDGRRPARRRARRDAAGPLRRAASYATGCAGERAPPFRYRDKGNLATIGRAAAVADIKGLRLSGFLAWMTWLVVHLWYLVGFQNRLLVFIRWSVSFATHGRGARLITNS